VINIVSRKGDMAGIDLPDNSFFFPFTGYQPIENPSKPAGSDEAEEVPDFRNSLAWEPDMLIKPGQKITYPFKTSDRSGRYMILIRGFTAEGKRILATAYFEVQ
jgi:hypothetical protein